MLVKHIVVESSIAYCKASKFAGIAVNVAATLNRSSYQAVLKQLLVEEASVTAEIANQIAYFGTDVGVGMSDQHLQIVVNVCVVDWLVEILVDSGQLRDQR